MPKYLVSRSGPLSIFICPRCKMKRFYKDMVQDPDTQQMMCNKGCIDLPDPYRLPPRKADVVDLKYPRPETYSVEFLNQIFTLSGDLVEASFDVVNDELIENLQTDNPLYIQTLTPEQPEEGSLWIQI